MTEIDQMLKDCETRESRLTDWERTFIDSLRNWVDGGCGVTKRQQGTLEAIWEKATAKG